MAIPAYLYHYYKLENGPFRNITGQGIEKALAIQSRISNGFNSKKTTKLHRTKVWSGSETKRTVYFQGRKP